MSTTSTRPIVRGTVMGVLAFALGYLLTYVWQASRIRESLQGINAIIQFFGGEQIPAWKAVGWLFFNSQFVRTHIPGIGGPRAQNFIASGDFPALLYVVPVVVLLAAGFILVWSRRTIELREGAMDGALIAIGYAGAAIIGLFAFGVTRSDASIAPDPVTGVLLAGIIYPLVLGAIGGALAGVVQASQRETGETTGD